MGERERKCEEEVKVKKGGDDLERGEEPSEGGESNEKGGKVGQCRTWKELDMNG